MVFIPYRNLSKDLLIKRQAKGKLKTSKLVFDLGELTFEAFSEKAQKLIYECPWAILHDKLVVQKNADNKVSLSVYAVDLESIDRIEKFIKEKI